jgi:predicted MPP superfamily phosphohydrolase
MTRRRFLAASVCAAAGSALYAAEIERHWMEITRREVYLPGLAQGFDGFCVVQLSDIHLDEFTEPFFLHEVVNRINTINPDAVFLTGDFITTSPISKSFLEGAAEQCARILNRLRCSQRYACLGNHDLQAGGALVAEALAANGITLLRNQYLPIERAGARFWLAGIDDPSQGHPDPEAAIPASIRNLPNEPVVLLCHGPDYVDTLLNQPEGQSVSLMLSGHTHGGQIRLPLIGPLILPPFGKKYVQGWFRFGTLQLHVNRGIGTVNLPFRLNCPPEITVLTLRSQSPLPSQI